MRKIICLVTCVIQLLLGLDSVAQWNLNGNPGATSQFIGTTDQSHFVVKTNNIERLKVLADGNIGIGVSLPHAKLHINGSLQIEENKDGDVGVFIKNRNIGARSREVFRFSEEGGYYAGLALNNITTQGAEIDLFNNKPQGYLTFTTAGRDRMRVENSGNISLGISTVDGEIMSTVMRLLTNGNVGIGTSTPSYKLDINGAARIQNGKTLNYTRSDGAAVGAIGWHSDGSFYIGGHPAFGPTAGSRVRVYGFGDLLSFGNGTSGDVINITPAGNVGIGTTTPSQKLHVNGNICYTGSIAACSDIRYKKSISPLTNSLNSLMALQGVYYSWDNDKFSDKGFTDERQIGFSAQEIEKLFPEIVQTDSEGYKAVDYSRLTPILVEAIKEQQKQIDELNRRLEKLEKILNLSK